MQEIHSIPDDVIQWVIFPFLGIRELDCLSLCDKRFLYLFSGHVRSLLWKDQVKRDYDDYLCFSELGPCLDEPLHMGFWYDDSGRISMFIDNVWSNLTLYSHCNLGGCYIIESAIHNFPLGSVLVMTTNMEYQSVFGPTGDLLYSSLKDMLTSAWHNITSEVIEHFDVNVDEDGAFIYERKKRLYGVVFPNECAPKGLEIFPEDGESGWLIQKALKSLSQLRETALIGSMELASILVNNQSQVHVFKPTVSAHRSPQDWTFRI